MNENISKSYEEIKSTYNQLNANVTLLDILLEFEELLQSTGLYGYANWDEGEVVSGPNLERHWVSVTLMYDYENMPDPEGGLRIKKLKGEVFFEKATFKEPVKITGTNDYLDPVSKRAEIKSKPVWLVTVKVPRKIINGALDAYIEEKIGMDDEGKFAKTGDGKEAVSNNSEIDDIANMLDDSGFDQ